jgi:hypothetical protein
VAVCFLYSQPALFAQEQATIAVKISLPTPTLHAGGALVIDMSTTNLTDHDVLISPFEVEALNSRGQDLGDQMAGVSEAEKRDEPTEVLRSAVTRIPPHRTGKIRLSLHPSYDSLTPGVYRVRLYRRDLKSKVTAYSNSVEVAVSQ